MKRRSVVLLLLISCLAAEAQRGPTPRADVNTYSAHASQDGVQVGAALLSAKEVRKIFSSDVNECCLVVEVAFYPPKDNFVKISLDGFMLREAGKDIGAEVSTPQALGPLLAFRPPAPDQEHTPGVTTTSGIGYERSGIDRGNGQRESRGGIAQHQGIGVGIPIGGKQQSPEAAAEDNRRAVQAELTEKMLPETSAWEPVSGYLYFAVPKKSKGGYELVYRLGDKKIVLPLK